jgi:hypothetical protein
MLKLKEKDIISINHKGELVPCQICKIISTYWFQGNNNGLNHSNMKKYLNILECDVIVQENEKLIFCKLIEEAQIISNEETKCISN